ncbi:hypothetical protein GCM10022631_19090 [Deinococcus rubellus]
MSNKRTLVTFGVMAALVISAAAFAQTPLSFGLSTLNLIESRALMSGNVDWEAQRMELIRNAAKLKSDQDVLPYLGEMLLRLNDNHSFYILGDRKLNLYQLAVLYKLKVDSLGVVTGLGQRFPTELKIGDRILEFTTDSGVNLTLQRTGKPLQITLPSLLDRSSGFSVEDENGVAYLKVPNQIGNQTQEDYYESGISALEDHGEACAWVVDLRDNNGGNLYQLIAALSPLLPNGKLLALEEKKGQPIMISIDASGINFGKDRVIALRSRTQAPNASTIAMIVNKNTKSAAEMMAMIFKKLHYRVYGEPTFGAVGYQTTIPLRKDIALQLVTGGALDESGKLQEGAVVPDEDDASLQSVLVKMKQRGSCQK